MYAFAFGGRRAAVERALRSMLPFYGPEAQNFWLATADCAAGNGAESRQRLEALAQHRDALIRRGAEDRLSRPVAQAAELLGTEAAKILDDLEQRLGHEERYAEQPGASAVKPSATWALIALNAAAFAGEMLAGAGDDPATLYRLGAVFSPGFTVADSWRLLASTFLHFGPVHLIMNLAALATLGPYLERALGRRRNLFVYLLSGTLGAASVLLFSRPVLLVGASGSIMGVLGGTLAVLLRGWRQENARPASRRLMGIVAIFALQVVFDLTTPQVSFTVHVAGMLIGCLTAASLKHWS
jgi:rhomboid protease GluP